MGEEVAQKERLYELSSIPLHPRILSMQTACFIVIALINSALLSIYRVSLRKGTLVFFCLISVLKVGFYFFTCVSESEF